MKVFTNLTVKSWAKDRAGTLPHTFLVNLSPSNAWAICGCTSVAGLQFIMSHLGLPSKDYKQAYHQVFYY